MLLLGSAVKGYAIEAKDGEIGSVSDLLFDDETWKIRWLVVDTGTWLTKRKVLVHPSAIGSVDAERQVLSASLTRAQIEGSPDLLEDQPVSRQMENNLYDYYGWDPLWGGSGYFGVGMGAISSPLARPPFFPSIAAREAAGVALIPDNGDPHLQSMAAVTGYHLHATDGEIGHVENFLIDNAHWDIRYLVIDTRNWWPGQHVLMSPYAVREINWPDQLLRVNVSRVQIKVGPSWNPAEMIGRAYEEQLHGHYGWPGYGV